MEMEGTVKTTECKMPAKSKSSSGANAGAGASGTLYCFGFIGALVYYIGHAASFMGGVVGFLKAIVWPAFVVYELMTFLKM